MRNNPLATVCICFCLGIWAARYVYIPLFFLYTSFILFLATALFSLSRHYLFLLALGLAISLAGFMHLQNSRHISAQHILRFTTSKSQKVYLIGRVVSGPEKAWTFYRQKKTVFTLKAGHLKAGEDWQEVSGLVRVTLYGEREVHYGDTLLLQGTLEKPPAQRNPGGFNYRVHLARQNIFTTLTVKEREAGKVISSPAGFSLHRELFRFKQRLRRLIYTHLNPSRASLLCAILLGERAGLSQDIKDLFIHTGTMHILAISGLHVGLMAFILIALFRFLGLGRRLTFISTIILLIGYAFLSGMRPSVVRATIMAGIVLLGLVINREIKIYNSLGLAALIILLFNPHYLFDTGFQLSFLSVISIVYFAPKIERFFALTAPRFLFLTLRAFSVSLAAWLGLAPWIALYFNIVTPVAVLANLVVVPYLFLVVGSGIAFLFCATLPVPGSVLLGQISGLSLSGLTNLVMLISKIPGGSFLCAQPSIFFFGGYFAAVLLIFNYKRLKLALGKVIIILLLIGNAFVWRPLFRASADRLRVTFLDVGMGDAIFIEFPDKGTMLIDGGPKGERDAGKWAILPFLGHKSIDKIDALLLSHPHRDHLGGLASVLKKVKINYVFDNGMPKESAGYRDYRRQVEKNVPHYRVLKRGERILGFPGVELLVLHPPRPFLQDTAQDINNNSLVLKLVYKEVSFLFCADIQKEAMEQLLAYGPMLRSTVLKVPHQGSDEGEVQDYLWQAISPRLAVISVDRDNRFGFPAKVVVERLRKLGAQVYQTGDSGAVIISTDGEDITVETMAGAEAGI